LSWEVSNIKEEEESKNNNQVGKDAKNHIQ
jgi:hypothetical protein